MGTVRFDLSEYTDFGSYIDPGRYSAKITNVEERTSEKSGNTYLLIRLVISEGQFAGHSIIDRVMTSGKAIFRAVNLLNALGVDLSEKIAAKASVNFDTSAFIGKAVRVEVEDNEYDGKTRSQVKTYLAKSQSAASDSDPLELPTSDAVKTATTGVPAPAASAGPLEGISDDGLVSIEDVTL